MNRIAAIAACISFAGGIGLVRRSTIAAAEPPGLVVRGSVRSISLPEGEPELPKSPGRETAQAFCVTCHTTQYIMIQPRFSREVWLAEVTKMRKAFSAPIPEEKVNEIVDYLVAVRGPEGK